MARLNPSRIPSFPDEGGASVAQKVTEALLEHLGKIPESQLAASQAAAADASKLATKAARKAAGTAGTLALPPGLAGWATIIPELIAVWKIQAQLVADIAALHGKKATLTQEQMLYCLFKHTGSQLFRDVIVRTGTRVLVKRPSLRVMQKIAAAIGVKVTQRVVAKGVTRWVPLLGAVGVGAYAYYDTAQVAKSALGLFSTDMEVSRTDDGEGVDAHTLQ